MESIKKILVALDLSDFDYQVLSYVKKLAGIVEAKEIHCVHVLKKDLVPKQLEEQYGDQIESLETQIEHDANQIVNQAFEGVHDQAISTKVLKGTPFEQIIKYAHDHSIDLITVGQKIRSEGSGIVPHRLSRKAHCSILMVPEASEPDFKRIFLPVDFSDYSDKALDFVELIHEKAPVDEVCIQNIYKIPLPSYKAMRTHEQMATIMKENAEEAYDRYIKEHQPSIGKDQLRPIFTLDDINKPGKLILEEARKNHAKLIVMGSKGQSSAAALLMGSVTEKLLKREPEIPVLIIKKKSENIGFLDALFR